MKGGISISDPAFGIKLNSHSTLWVEQQTNRAVCEVLETRFVERLASSGGLVNDLSSNNMYGSFDERLKRELTVMRLVCMNLTHLILELNSV